MTGRGTLVAGAAAVACVSAVVYAGQSPDALRTDVRHPQTVASSIVTLTCPGSPPGWQTSTSVVAATPTPGRVRSDRGGDGVVTISRLSSGVTTSSGRLTSRGSSLETPPVTHLAPLTVVGVRGLAPGLTAVQWSRSRGDAVSGTAVTSCQQPADSWWFNGVDTSVGSTSTLVLSNPTTALSVVDLSFYGPDGEPQVVGGRGIAVAARSSRSLALARYAPGLDPLTVGVNADQGRVVAAVHSTRSEGTSPRGSDWIPSAQVPSTEVLVNAGFPGVTDQRLAITNPGLRDALVRVRVIDVSGQFVPIGLSDVRVPPGSVAVERLGPVTNGAVAVVRLTSTVPVTAATVTSTRGRHDDFAVATSSADLEAPAIVPIVRRAELSLVFGNAARTGSRVTVETADATGVSLSSEIVQIPGSTVVTWTAPHERAAAYVVVTAEVGGSVHGVAQYRGDQGIAALPIVSGSYTVTRPAVGPAASP